MANEWKVILRAGDLLDLSQNDRAEYVNLASEVYADKISEAPSIHQTEQFDQFLNREIFPDPRIVEFVHAKGAPQEITSQFENGEIEIKNLVKSWHQIQFSLDELIDMVMMLKLIRDYSRVSHEGRISSRYRLQKLVYTVNALIEQEDPLNFPTKFEEELGLLDRTGYRYQFFKRDSGPFAEQVYEDKNRLFAWNLVDEPIVDSEGTGEVAEQNRRYGIELSAQGEILTERFYDKIENSDSFMVSAWNFAQKEAVEMVSDMNSEELVEHIKETTDANKSTGDELLSGPDRKFKKNDVRFLGQLAEKVEEITETSQSYGVVA